MSSGRLSSHVSISFDKADSASPKTMTHLWKMSVRVLWARMSWTMSGMAPTASKGTPGSEYRVALWPNLLSGNLNTMTGAVPFLLTITSHASGTRAWALLMSSTSSPREWRIPWMILSWGAFSTYFLLPESSASAAFVMSSLVGPRPPVVMTMSLRPSSSSRLRTMVSWSSPNESILVTMTPFSSSALDMLEELVSTIWPMSISSPIVQIEALTIWIMLF